VSRDRLYRRVTGAEGRAIHIGLRSEGGVAIMAVLLGRARAISVLSIAAAAIVAAPGSGLAGAPVSKGADLPWADPAHQGQLELLAGQIASSLAARTVAVHCESPSSWQALATQLGFDPSMELGYVPVSYDPLGETVAADSTLVELAPQVCLSLQQFASTDPKPTTCTVTTTKRQTVLTKRRVLVHRRVTVDGRVRVRTVWKVELVRTTVARITRSAPRPCFAAGKPVSGMTNAYWSRYADDASAILVLAHEAVHLTQYQAGLPVLAQGEAESQAQCIGMQWMHSVAEQLGDTPADAESIAQFTYADIYPNFEGTPYWSPDCVAHGALDRRPSEHTAWP
jgi:hypothetical protein